MESGVVDMRLCIQPCSPLQQLRCHLIAPAHASPMLSVLQPSSETETGQRETRERERERERERARARGQCGRRERADRVTRERGQRETA
jgi:hypothetical protein